MNLPTRDRLLRAATRLFAEGGYRGASVRDICNQAGANPGAVSYHFGGKKQLYRSVLRHAAATVASMGPDDGSEIPDSEDLDAGAVVRRLLLRLQEEDSITRLLLRDLADGGTVAVEALTPLLRSAIDHLMTARGDHDDAHGRVASRRLFLELAAPVFLLTAGWPVVARALDVGEEDRRDLLDDLVQRALGGRGGNLSTGVPIPR